jgi:hypothetical protein
MRRQRKRLVSININIKGVTIMPVLSNATLKLELVSNSTQVKATATIKVNFDAFEESLIKNNSLKFKLKCRVWGEDGGFNGSDDPLFWMDTKTITADDTYTFTRTVSRSRLDEDWGNDEIYARFFCQSTTPGLPLTAKARTNTISGRF